jgi:hypothetical protein
MELNAGGGALVGWDSGGSGTDTTVSEKDTADMAMELNSGGGALVGWESGGSGTEEGGSDDFTDQPLILNMPLPPQKASESSADVTMTDSSS